MLCWWEKDIIYNIILTHAGNAPWGWWIDNSEKRWSVEKADAG